MPSKAVARHVRRGRPHRHYGHRTNAPHPGRALVAQRCTWRRLVHTGLHCLVVIPGAVVPQTVHIRTHDPRVFTHALERCLGGLKSVLMAPILRLSYLRLGGIRGLHLREHK